MVRGVRGGGMDSSNFDGGLESIHGGGIGRGLKHC